MAQQLDEPRQVLWTAAGDPARRPGAALRTFDRAVTLARERSAAGFLAHALGLRANLALWDGRLLDAVADADEAARLAEDIGAENTRACRSRASLG